MRYLEELLSHQNIPFGPSHDFDLGSRPRKDESTAHSPLSERSNAKENVTKRKRANTGSDSGSEWEQKEESDKLNKLVSNIGMVSVQGASDPRFLGSTSGISFARVVFAAVKSSVPGGDKSGRGSKRGSVGSAAATSGTSMRDSFFGLQTKPNIKPAPFPDRELGLRLVNLYFEHANPQIPILHRGEFMVLFGRAYAAKDRRRSARELYILNIVFAIGAGIILEDASAKHSPSSERKGSTPPDMKQEPASPNPKKPKSSSQQRPAEEYHASAMMHLESFLGGSMPAADRSEGVGGGLEQLQAVLLLAGFALLRPVAPGLWYITGVAMRLGVDLGLHYEDGAGLDATEDSSGLAGGPDSATGAGQLNVAPDPKERGRREWVRDLRRRLWWCVYSFDRLVSTCVGRPFGISDAVITTDWPSVLDDKDITPTGFLLPSEGFTGPSSKRVAHHYFRLRLLQSEILQVLQYRQAQRVHAKDGERKSPFMHTKLSCAFLQPFESFHAWRTDIDRRLWEWKESAPLQQDTTVQFSIKFLELNYWQAVIMLYRQSLSVPHTFAGEVGPHNDVESPMTANVDSYEDEDEIFLKVAEAGQRVLKLYRQLHRVHLVNYTYLATVHLFMAGIAFLYSIWHSPTVRSRLVSSLSTGTPFLANSRQTLDDVDFTVLAATSVLGDLIDKCPPAEACRDAFERMSKATVKMCVSTTGFGSQVKFAKQRQDDDSPIIPQQDFNQRIPPPPTFSSVGTRPPPQFDYDLKNLFSDDAQNGRMFHRQSQTWQAPLPSIAPNQAPTYASTLSTTTSSNTQQTPMAPPNQPFDSSSLLPTSSFPPSIDINDDPTAYDNYDFDFLMNNDTTNTAAVFSGDVAGNLGFDGQPDWADGGGQLPDLFGGFFFGPQAGGENGLDSGDDGGGGGGGFGNARFDEGVWTNI